MRVPRVVEAGRQAYKRLSDEEAVSLYFELYNKIKETFSGKDFEALLGHCVASLPLVERYVQWFKKTGSGNPVQIPAIYYACRFFPVIGGRGQLENIRELAEFIPELGGYNEYIELAMESVEVARRIRLHLAENPGMNQNQLKEALDYDDGRRFTQLVKDMESLGQLERQRTGKTYQLFLVVGTKP
jgi:hypothetical protein